MMGKRKHCWHSAPSAVSWPVTSRSAGAPEGSPAEGRSAAITQAWPAIAPESNRAQSFGA